MCNKELKDLQAEEKERKREEEKSEALLLFHWTTRPCWSLLTILKIFHEQ